LITATYETRIASTGIAVEFRHVSAHKGVVTPRNAVNTWCDKECRRLMRLARDAVSADQQDHPTVSIVP
jgi:serine/threonine-protein kinase RIO1